MAWGVPKIGTVAEAASGNLTLAEPAGTAQGDLQIACIAIRSNVGFTNADWTKIEGQLSGDTDNTNGIASGEMWYRVRGASAGTLQFSRTGGDLGRGCIIAYTGGKLSSAVLGNHTSATAGASSATASTATFNTTEASELIVAMTSAGDNLTASAFDAATDPTTASGATDTTTAPTAGTWIERVDSGSGTGADGAIAIADAIRATAGATGTISAAISVAARHVMIASAFRMLVDTAVAAAVGAVVIAGLAPTVTTTNNAVAAPPTGAIVVEGFAPTVTTSDNQIAAPGTGTIVIEGLGPTINIGVSVAPGVGTVAIEGIAPTVTASAGVTVTPDVGTVTIEGVAPTVTTTAHVSAAPVTGTVDIEGVAPTVTTSAHQTAASLTGTVTIAGLAPAVVASDHQIAATLTGSIIIEGLAPTVTATQPGTVETQTGTVIIVGLAPTVTAIGHVSAAPGTGAVAIEGIAPSVVASDHQLAATQTGAVVIAGLAPTIESAGGAVADTATGTVVIAGIAPTVTASTSNLALLVTDVSAAVWSLADRSERAYHVTDLSTRRYLCEVRSMPDIDCAVDFDAAVYIERVRPRAAEEALSGVTLRLAATKGGDAIDASLSGTATEDTANPGTYVCTFDLADLQAHLLPTYSGRSVYLVVEKEDMIETRSFRQRVLPMTLA